MGQKFDRTPHHALIQRMVGLTVHGDHHALLHFVACHYPLFFLTSALHNYSFPAALGSLAAAFAPEFWPSSFCRRRVLTRAISLRSPRIFSSTSACPAAI